MTPPVTTDALVDRKALRKAILAAIPENVPLRGRYATVIMERAVAPLLAAHQQVTAERDEARAENDRFRAGLANGTGPCAYCNLSREDWSKCRSGFPGCDRTDDAVLCPHFGAEMEANDRAEAAEDQVFALRAEGEAKDRALKEIIEQVAQPDADDFTYAVCQALIRAKNIARTALARAATAREG